jgi:ubiquinone/menaquinone biosynthesis C-methylase UbiE
MEMNTPNERRYGGDIERLRSAQRLALMEVERVVDIALAGITPSSALDVGTGSGLFAEAFAAKGLSVAGIDLREDMLEAARQYVPGGIFKLGRMEAVPFADAEFDLVFLGHVLHEADDLVVALREAKRTARMRVVVLEWPYAVQEYGPPLDHRLKPEQVDAAAAEAGFQNVEQIILTQLVLYRMELSEIKV